MRIGDEYLQLKQTYHLATKKYLHGGSDGYLMLKDVKVIVSLADCISLDANCFMTAVDVFFTKQLFYF